MKQPAWVILLGFNLCCYCNSCLNCGGFLFFPPSCLQGFSLPCHWLCQVRGWCFYLASAGWNLLPFQSAYHPNSQILEMLERSFNVSTYFSCLFGTQSCSHEAGRISDTASGPCKMTGLLWQGPCIARRVQLSPTSHAHYCFYLHARNTKAVWPSLPGANMHFWGQCFDRNNLCEECEQNLPLFLLCASQAAQVFLCALPAAATIASMDSFHPKYWMKYIRISALMQVKIHLNMKWDDLSICRKMKKFKNHEINHYFQATWKPFSFPIIC